MNKKALVYAILALIYAFFVVIVGRMGGVFGLVHHAGLWIGFLLLLRYRTMLAEWLCTRSFPTLLVYLVSALPLMLFEENVNCLPSGCRLIPVTIPFLMLFLVVVYVIVTMTKAHSLWRIVLPACAVGLLWEVTVGVAGPEFRALPVLQFIYISLWTWMSYAFFTIVPVQFLLQKQKNTEVR
jgi:hypothetical protein